MPRHITEVPLRWADMDAYRHVNNTAYLRYLQEARVDMLFVHAAQRGAPELAAGVVVNRHEIDYLAPLRFRLAPLRVETWVREVRNATFTLGYEILDADSEHRHVYARATTVLVPYHLATSSPRRVSADERAVLETYVDADGARPRAGGAARPARSEVAKTHVYSCAVRFDDLDSYGHVNNVQFAEYIQEARIDFVEHSFAGGVANHGGSVVAGQSIEYLAPVPFRIEPLQVYVWVSRIGASSFDLAYEVADEHQVFARCATMIVAYDFDAHRSRQLTPTEQAGLEPFLKVGT
ncbi:acyl-CoA thioesterase [Phytoactinopolyspora mesophila]|uniref:Acyl-CoA thioesterase n=1 Tax=Phytoactinopolyspora mesophila TaxID=2650750 RepID=A0A7K3M6T4_9ACTN|nr:thioesterase family protein [Phytoactinopolyspora mesophila]NDL58986.1 acyl-CoA thioesterase [Phytoactinopolyspora mesophila]